MWSHAAVSRRVMSQICVTSDSKAQSFNHPAVLFLSIGASIWDWASAPHFLSSPWEVDLTLVLCHPIQTTLISHLDYYRSLLAEIHGLPNPFFVSFSSIPQPQSILYTVTTMIFLKPWGLQAINCLPCESPPWSCAMLSLTLCAPAIV